MFINGKIYSLIVILSGEELTRKDESVIGCTDYTVAAADETIKGNKIQRRISVVKN